MRARITLLLVLAGCGGTTYAFEGTDDVRAAVQAAYTPVYVALFSGFLVSFGEDPENCPSVTRQGEGDWRVEGGGCTDDEGTTWEGHVDFEDYDTGGLSDDARIAWRDFTGTEPDGNSFRIAGNAVIHGDEAGLVTADLTVDAEGQDDTGLFAEGRWDFDGLRYRSPSAELGGSDSYDLEVRVSGPLGSYRVEGSAAHGTDCESEPVRGQLDLHGADTVTVTLDGGEQCDGKTPVSGAVQGEIDWQGSFPMMCGHTGPAGLGGMAGLLGLLLVRRRQER